MSTLDMGGVSVSSLSSISPHSLQVTKVSLCTCMSTILLGTGESLSVILSGQTTFLCDVHSSETHAFCPSNRVLARLSSA